MKMPKLVTLPIDELKPYPGNAKIHAPAQIRAIANSIKKLGYRELIIIDRDNFIVAGHARHEALKELQEREVVCIYADDMTEEQVAAYRLADNKLAEAGYDEGKIQDELLKLSDEMVALTGYERVVLEKDEVDEAFEKYTNDNCEYPIVPQYSEKHDAVIIVCDNEVDINHLKGLLGLEKSKSYKGKTTGETLVIDIKYFLEKWAEKL